MTTLPTRFESSLDLARLPWFEVQGGSRLVVVDEAVGPVIDMHTHLAMGYLRRLRVDVSVETPATAYYFPLTLPVDLEGYANANFDESALASMRLDLSAMSLTGSGMRRTHTAPNLLRDMRDLGIERSVVLPIDWPVGPQNTDVVLEACAPHPELVPFASVHPHRRDVDAWLDRHRAAGARGVKVHPAVQGVAPDHPKVVHLCGRCGAKGLPVLFHCGPVGIAGKAADARCQVPRYEQVIAEHPDTTFVLGHSGALQVREALDYAERYPNTWFELASLGLESVREVLDRVPSDRIVYGTDWPFYHQALTLARVLLATEGAPDLRRAVLHDNAARLLDA
ncbi:MAG: amidohydrolase family protein [Microthrixaceae bacterium]|nr:amidohydrolase family protein [Microthrixaceae bacterium]